MKAFPSEKKLYWLFRQGDKPIPNDVIEQGMDLRDYFAAYAMAEMFSGGWIHSGEIEEVDLNHLAKWSFKMADAMMEARKK